MFHAHGRMDGLTDMTKLTVAFRKFGNAPKNGTSRRAGINFLHRKYSMNLSASPTGPSSGSVTYRSYFSVSRQRPSLVQSTMNASCVSSTY